MPDLKYSICVGHHLMHYKNGWLKYNMLFFLHFQVFLGGDGGSIFYLFILISDFKGTFEEEKSGELVVNSLEERMFCSTKVLLAMLKLYTYTQTMQNVYVVLFFFHHHCFLFSFVFVSNFHFHALYSSFIQHNSLDQEEFSTFQPEDSHTGWQRQRCKINAQITERMDS